MTKTKLIFIVFFIFAIGTTINSQEVSKNALGVRIGDNDGTGAEISYQRALSGNNRLEFDLGWRNSRDIDIFKLAGLYQWVFNLDKGFNWYVGPGGGIGSVNYENNTDSFFFLAGDIGIEYNFEIPLVISLDFRPEFGFSDFNDDLDFDIGLGIRYQFN